MAHLPPTKRGEGKRRREVYGRRDAAGDELRTVTEEPIFLLLRRCGVIDCRRGLDEERVETSRSVVAKQVVKECSRHGSAHFGRQQQPTVGQPAVRNHLRDIVTDDARREKRDAAPLLIHEQHGAVREAVAVVVHEIAAEQKRVLPTATCGLVPQCAKFGGVGKQLVSHG